MVEDFHRNTRELMGKRASRFIPTKRRVCVCVSVSLGTSSHPEGLVDLVSCLLAVRAYAGGRN